MSSPRPSPASTTRSVLGLLAIPFVSVTSATLVGDVASSSDPRRLAWGSLGLAIGTIAGLALVHFARLVAVGLTAVADAVVGWTVGASGWTPAGTGRPLATASILVPPRSTPRGPILRRGPPHGSV